MKMKYNNANPSGCSKGSPDREQQKQNKTQQQQQQLEKQQQQQQQQETLVSRPISRNKKNPQNKI